MGLHHSFLLRNRALSPSLRRESVTRCFFLFFLENSVSPTSHIRYTPWYPELIYLIQSPFAGSTEQYQKRHREDKYGNGFEYLNTTKQRDM